MGKGAAPKPATPAPACFDKGVYVLTGPAGSGKTAAALGLYRARLDDLARPGCLLIVPNFPAAAQVRRRLLAAAPTGVLVAPAVTTFAGLAAGVLSGAGAACQRLTAVQRHLLLARIIGELSSAGGLRALAALADAPGLVSALDEAIAELKRAAVDPEQLARAVDPRSASHADLLEVYRRYQQHLLRTGRFDVEGQMWLARDVLARDPHAPLGWPDVSAVAVDGFTDFTPTQLEMLALLGRRVETVLVTLPLVADDRRRLWDWTRRTLQRLQQAIPAAQVLPPRGPDPMGSLFDLAGAATAGSEAGPSIALLEAAEVEAEVRAAARAVKAQLADGAAPGSIAVLARSLDAYAAPIERIFAAHDVPVAPRPVPLATANAVRYVLRLLSLPPEYEFHDVLAAINSSYFVPGALGGFDEATVATAEMAIRAANVPGGRDSYAAALARLARRARMAAGEPDEPESIHLGPLAADAAAIEKAAAMLGALLGRLEALSSAAGPAEYVSAVRGLTGELRISAAAARCDDDAVVAADLRALEAFDELLDDVASAGLPAGAGPAGWAEVLARAAAVATVPPPRGEALVAVLDVLDARALRFETVHLLGVNEKAFPHLRQDRCFIDESDRARWAGRGVALDRRRDLLGREMLLFYLAATRGERALTVSHVAADAAGKAHSPSVFVAELEAAAERQGLALRRGRIGPGQFVPPMGELSSPADAFNAAMAAAFGDPTGAPRPPAGAAAKLLGWAAEHRGELLARAAFGLFAADRRWREGPPDAFDGRIDDDRLLKHLAERIPARFVFSATELNSYAGCPWRFFAEYLLGLEPLAAPAARMTPADRGSFCHAVLWRTLTALRDRFGSPVGLAELDAAEVEAALAAAVEAEKRRLAEAAVHSRLWEAQTRFWHGLLAGYLADQRGRQDPAAAMYFELGFGAAGIGDDRIDPASRGEPVTVRADPFEIRLRGKIDRVDRVGESLLAVDYKTGRLPAAGDIRQGLDLQLALYAKALEAMFGEPVAGGAYHDLRENRHRYFTASRHPRGRGGEPADYDGQLAHAMARLAEYVAGMRAGRFDALPAHRCPAWCAYRTICHYSEDRARRKGAAAEVGEGDDE